MKEVVCLISQIEPMLFPDPQAAVPASRCPYCGGERYGPGELCLRCERGLP